MNSSPALQPLLQTWYKISVDPDIQHTAVNTVRVCFVLSPCEKKEIFCDNPDSERIVYN